MAPAVQSLLPLSEVAHVGLRRDEVTLQPEVYLDRLPADLSGRRVVVCYPMLATGGSMAAVCAMIAQRGAQEVVALCVLASAPGLERLGGEHPTVRVASGLSIRSSTNGGSSCPGWVTRVIGCLARRTDGWCSDDWSFGSPNGDSSDRGWGR